MIYYVCIVFSHLEYNVTVVAYININIWTTLVK